ARSRQCQRVRPTDSVLCHSPGDPRDLHYFPTRRSSDLFNALPDIVGEAHAHVQGESLKAWALSCLRVLNSPTLIGGGVMCERCAGLGYVFYCPKWPRCNCPDGTVVLNCPGEKTPCPECAAIIDAHRSSLRFQVVRSGSARYISRRGFQARGF